MKCTHKFRIIVRNTDKNATGIVEMALAYDNILDAVTDYKKYIKSDPGSEIMDLVDWETGEIIASSYED